MIQIDIPGLRKIMDDLRLTSGLRWIMDGSRHKIGKRSEKDQVMLERSCLRRIRVKVDVGANKGHE